MWLKWRLQALDTGLINIVAKRRFYGGMTGLSVHVILESNLSNLKWKYSLNKVEFANVYFVYCRLDAHYFFLQLQISAKPVLTRVTEIGDVNISWAQTYSFFVTTM